jgi:transposase-like protein
MRKFMQLIILLFIVLIPLRVDAEEPICKHDNSLWHSNWKKIDEAYHSVDCHCNECGKDFTIKEKHDLDYIRTIKKATLLSKGVHQYKCDSCGAILNETFSWSLSQVEDGNAVSYNCSKVSKVYRNSKKITIWLRNPIKGSIIKVKIGKKTYTKKIKTKKKIKIKIKKPKYGKQIGPMSRFSAN